MLSVIYKPYMLSVVVLNVVAPFLRDSSYSSNFLLAERLRLKNTSTMISQHGACEVKLFTPVIISES
jgi:hypothetical protein